MEGSALMPEYRVEWSVEVEADDPEASAHLALAILPPFDQAMSKKTASARVTASMSTGSS